MTIEEHISKMKDIYKSIIMYIEDNSPTSLTNQIKLFDKLNIRDNLHEVKAILHIIVKISNNHHRGPYFFSKIEEIIKYFKDQIKNYFPNSEIFSIFKSNKRFLLFLISERIMIFDKYIFKRITEDKYIKLKYPQYFAPEIKAFKKQLYYSKEEGRTKFLIEKDDSLPQNFYELRREGENEN